MIQKILVLYDQIAEKRKFWKQDEQRDPEPEADDQLASRHGEAVEREGSEKTRAGARFREGQKRPHDQPVAEDGGSGASQRAGIRAVSRAARSVAREPKITSKGPYGLKRFASTQPRKRPQAEPGKKNGSTQSASEKRNWTGP